MKLALGALAEGLWSVARSPGVLALVCLLTIAAVVPFGIVLGSRLQEALANQPPIDLGAEEVDAEWWLEFRAQARGLEATFTPAIIGFAAPLDNLSALADATPRPIALAGPVLFAVLLWAFLWGALIDRFYQPAGPRPFVAVGLRHFPRMALVSLAAATVVLLLYFTVHRVLFDWVFPPIASSMTNERESFFVRVALYLVFVVMLAVVALAADYTRIGVVGLGAKTLRQALAIAVRFMRAHWREVWFLYVMTGLLFVCLLIVYGIIDRRAGGWRGVIVGQAYLVARLAIRLVGVASQVALVKRMGDGAGTTLAIKTSR